MKPAQLEHGGSSKPKIDSRGCSRSGGLRRRIFDCLGGWFDERGLVKAAKAFFISTFMPYIHDPDYDRKE